MQIQSLGWEDPLEAEMTTRIFQYSCLDNPTDRGAWRATVQKVGHKELDTTERSVHRKQLPVTTGIIIDTIIITIDKPKNHNSICVQKSRLETDLEGPFHSKTFFCA